MAGPAYFLPADVMRALVSYVVRNRSLLVGTLLLLALVLFVVIGRFFVDTEDARALSAPSLRPPSWDYPFGTDRQGRDLLAVMVAGTPLTLRIGFIAGFLGVGIGSVLAFTAAFYRGMTDTIIRSVADIGLTVPGLLVLILIAVSVQEQPDGERDGADRCLAGVAQSDADDPRAGADVARAGLCRAGGDVRHGRAGDHLSAS